MGPRRLVATALALTVTLAALLTLPAAAGPQVVLENYWFTSSTGGPVYPGSSNARFTVVVRNVGNDTAYGVTVCLYTPTGFKVAERCSVLGNLSAGDAVQHTFLVDADRSVEPGYYDFTVRISYGGGWHSYTVTVEVHPYPKPLVRVVDSWVEPLGEANETGLTLVMVLEAVNMSVQGGYGWLHLPEGFTPTTVPLDVPSISEGERVRIRVTGLHHTGRPGVYAAEALLVLQALTDDGVTYWTNVSVTVPVALGKPHPLALGLLDAYWSAGGYPGSRSSRLALVLVNNDYCSVGPIYVRLVSGNAVIAQAYTAATVQPKGMATLSLELDVPYAEAVQGVLEAYASMSCNGERRLGHTLLNVSVPARSPTSPLSLVDAYLQPSYLAVNASAVSLQPVIMLQTLSGDTLVSLTVEATVLPPAVFTYGRSRAVVTVTGSYGYGSVVSVQLPYVTLPAGSGYVTINLTVTGVYEVSGSRYMVSYSKLVTLRLRPVKPLQLLSLWVEYDGEPSPLLPGQRGARIHVRLLNTLNARVSIDDARLDIANATAQLIGLDGCGQLAGRSSCELTFWVNVSETASGRLPATLEVTYTVTEGGQVSKTVWSLELVVGRPSDYSPRVEVAGVWWGQAGSPSRPYPGERRVPLTILLVNTGHYPASTIVVSVSGDVEQLSKAMCRRLQPAGACTATLYVDVPWNATSPLTLTISIEYLYTVYGGVYSSARTFTVSLSVADVRPEGIKLVDYRWAGDRKAYPGTAGAELDVVLANENPFTVNGLWGQLTCSSLNATSESYVEGPLPAYGSATLAFRLDIPSTAEPGNHVCRLALRYWMSVGDTVVERRETLTLAINVSDPGDAFSVLEAYLAEPAGPGSRGVPLMVVVEAKDTGSTLLHAEARLPEGMYATLTGGKVLILSPTALPVTPTGVSGQQLARILAQTVQEAQPSPLQLLRGTVTLVDLRPRDYSIELTLVFRDGWGSVHKAAYQVRVLVTGRPEPLKVELLTPKALVVNGTATLRIAVVNNGSSPLYDVYVALTPTVPSAFPLEAVRYIGSLDPGERVVITYRVAFNPAGYMGQKTNTFSAAVAVIYRDPYGRLRSYNTSISMLALMPPKLVVKEAEASYTNGTIAVKLVLVNIGGATASRSIVYLEHAGKTLAYTVAGDVDPGSELPLKLEARLTQPAGEIVVRVVYFDDYNNEYSVVEKLPVSYTPSQPPAVSSSQASSPTVTGEMLVVAAVAAFLAAVGAAIYGYLRRHQARLGGVQS